MVAAGAIAGSVVPVAGNVVGAVVGLVSGLVIYFLTDALIINGKSIRDWIKEWYLDAVNYLGEALDSAFDYISDCINDFFEDWFCTNTREKV